MSVSVRPTGNANVDDFQREVVREFAAVAQGIAAIPRSPLDNAVVLDDIAVSNGTATTHEHRLGKVHQGWLVIGKTATVDVWEVLPRAPGRLVLMADADTTITVLVF